MGDVISGVFGGGQRQEQQTTPDLVAQGLNSLRYQQLADLFGTGNISTFASPYSDIYKTTPAESDLFSLGYNIPWSPERINAEPQADLSNLMSFDAYKDLGLSQLGNYISQIATPEILSSMSLQGLEGGGAVPEAIAKATAQAGLPFVQSLPGASTALTMTPLQAEQMRQQSNLLVGQGSLIAPQAGVMGAQRAGALLPLADLNRSLQEQDLLRRQGLLTTGLTGIPFTPGSSTTGQTRTPSIFENIFGLGSATGGFFGQPGGLG